MQVLCSIDCFIGIFVCVFVCLCVSIGTFFFILTISLYDILIFCLSLHRCRIDGNAEVHPLNVTPMLTAAVGVGD